MGQKLPFNKLLNPVVLGAAMEFASNNIVNYFQQIEDINTLKKAQNSSQLSIHLLMWGVLEGNLKEKNWMNQFNKFIFITKNMHEE